MITNKHNSNLPQTLPVIPPITTENLTNIPPNLPQPPVTPPISTQNQSNIVNEPMITNQPLPAELSSFHPNEDVVTAILRFEEGEMQHGINTCKTCLETRPVFHVTPPINKPGNNETAPVLLKPWEICKDGRCQRCHTESLGRARKHVKVAAKFSGAFSVHDDDLGPATHTIRDNGMHFLPVPPYLQNLTLLEISLIRRITVIMNIHLLRYGMLASKGHCISLPQRMRIATELPLLPSEVGIVVLRKKGSKTTIRHYTVERNKVENALRGLCFGYPEGGLEFPQGAVNNIYHGPDHDTRPLKGRYFQYLPNQYYKDVCIKQDRIDNLPECRAELPDLPVIELPEIIPETDKGPAKNQFVDEMPTNDENITRSGIICPLEPKDVDKELKIVLNRLLGSEAAAEEAIQHGAVAGADMEYTRENPVNELKTPGFFAMAYPTVFINGSCDFTVPRLVKMYIQ